LTDVAKWLNGLGMGQYADAFAENDVDFDVLSEITDEDLKSLGVSLGHRKKILRGIRELSPPEAPRMPEAPTQRSEPGSSQVDQGERRHLTVLFADMVGSTKLSSELDPEDYQSVIRAYQEACATAVARYDGYLAKYLGDGILAYFGYPRAHEDDAERAIRAGRDVIAAVSALEPFAGLALKSRIGIATGEVVVGETIGEGASEESTVAGEAPNLAARLQSIARSDTVVISGRTRRLVEGRFTIEDLGPQTVKGFAQPVEAFMVGEATEAQTRFEAGLQRGLSQLVGREEEVGLFLRRWDQVKEGEGQVILLSAEAGVGKSRILRAVQDRLKGEALSRVLYFGSPFHQNSALYPAADQLRRVLRLDKHEDEDAILDRLEGVLDGLAIPAQDCAPFFASMLGVDSARRYGALDLRPEEFRAQTLEAIVAVIERMSEQNPVLMFVEDAHWIDPTTLELIGNLVARLRDKRILLVIAFRPEFEASWGREGHVTSCTLNHLSRKECTALVSHLTGGKILPEDVVGQIVSRTDGVPLFVEELTKSILESGYLQDAGGRYEMRGSLSSLAIPDSLQESLMARLDRLSPAKEIAQTAAVIGRQFPYELLAEVVELEEEHLDEALEDLVGSGLLFRHGAKPDAIFEFKHALIRDASYESLLKSNRHRIHHRIAEILEKGFPDQGETEPELLAHHFEGAGKTDKAVAYWQMAGLRGSDRSAYQEAIAHCERGLLLADTLSDLGLRSKWELELQLVIGMSLMAIDGFSSPKVMAAYSRAHDLAKQLNEQAKLFAASWGMYIHQQQTGQIESARRTTDELLQLSERLGDSEFQLEAHHAAWTICFRMGDFERCRYHAEQGIVLHNPDEHFPLVTRYAGHDAGICARNHAALSSWFLGYPDQAVDHDRAGAVLTDLISHPLSKAHGKCFGSILYRHLGDPETARTYAEGSLKISRNLGYPQYKGFSEVIHGWAIAQIREDDEGIAIIDKALDDLTKMGAWARCGTFLPCLVDILAKNNESEKALEAVDRALDLIRKSGERTAETEILVLKGEVLERTNAARTEVEATLQAALDTARKDGARAMELRAATALARVRREAGRGQEARQLLAPLYSWFTEGFETTDLKDAKALLDDLA
jgi:class 3 adenylate cyclase/tetratricopeptide (TPR) repeat protein